MRIWRLKKGSDIRLRSGHPWVFSNELTDSPKSIQPGDVVEVQDLKGQFLARGYGNPQSLIAFRALTFDAHIFEPQSTEQIINKLVKSWKNRFILGFKESFRLCFSESDFLPGIIIDRYVTESAGKRYQVFSYQILTYGMQRIFGQPEAIFQGLVQKINELGYTQTDWAHTILLEKNDVHIRKLEGLQVEEPRIVYNPDQVDLQNLTILIPSVYQPEHLLQFEVNLIEGQKTGFFLDQTQNIKLLIETLKPRLSLFKDKKMKIIDLCCYMGQWSVQLAHFLNQNQIQAEITLVDVSELAIQMARKNLSKIPGIDVKYIKTDVLEGLTSLPDSQYDVVISDPPAFVKNKKDLETGLHGYMKLNQQAFRIAQHSGLVVSCTCSGLVGMTDFKNSLRKSIVRSSKRAKLLLEGGLGLDHPQLLQFPEGQYLKMLLHSVE